MPHTARTSPGSQPPTGAGTTAEGQVVGVAPGAQLLAYNVFGCNGSTDSDVMVHAMELALADHADVLNMSIGSAFSNWPQSPEAVAADNLVDAGMIVVASIGNSGVNGGQLWSAGSPGCRPQGDRRGVVRQHEGDFAGVPGRVRACTRTTGPRRLAGDLPSRGGSAPISSTGDPDDGWRWLCERSRSGHV